MEISDENEYYKNTLLNSIDFETAYSGSNNWIGFFEKKYKYNENYVNESIAFFSNYFFEQLNDLVICVSFFVDEKKCNSKKKNSSIRMLDIEKELIRKNYILVINEDEYFDDEEEFDKKHYNLSTTFRIFNSNRKYLEYLSRMAMQPSPCELSDGHCFFISVKSNLIIYPHDESGYGCFKLHGSDNNSGYDFLKKASALKNFDAFVYSYKDQIMEKIE